MSVSGMAAQFTVTKGCDDRGDRVWIVDATSSLPVPDSPRTRTAESPAAA